MYAGATPGGGAGPGVFLGSGIDKGFDGLISGSADNEASLNPPAAAAETTATADATASGTKPAKGRTNIQIIRSRKEKEVLIAIS